MKVHPGSLIAVALITLAACADDKSPTDVTRAYLRAIGEGDSKRACGLMTDSFRRATLAGDHQGAGSCEQSIEKFSALLGSEGRRLIQNARLSPEDTDSGWSFVRIEGHERTPLRGELFTLHELDGEWRIHGQNAPDA